MRTIEEIRAEVLSGNIRAFYDSKQWHELRASVRERDHNICQRCAGHYQPDQTRPVRLRKCRAVHHIIPLTVDFDHALDPDNLVSLCHKCHEEIEGRDAFQFCKRTEPLTAEKW